MELNIAERKNLILMNLGLILLFRWIQVVACRIWECNSDDQKYFFKSKFLKNNKSILQKTFEVDT